MVNSTIECQINYIKNNKSFLIENISIDDYKNKRIFENFKKKIINRCINNLCDKIQLTLNYEEKIIMYLTNIERNEYLIEVNKYINQKEEHLETLYIIPKYGYRYNYLIPVFFYPFY